ncbi:MAG: hypothetical protein Q7S06_02585 [Nanoarchaeota archaeon]|nr:hypothetical protein [Nanoarchaeota archaeon]
MAKTLKKIINNKDFLHTGFNFTLAWGAGFAANVFSNFALGFPLNHFNSIEHFAAGVGIGTYAYRKVYQKTGSTALGVAVGLLFGTALSIGWEWFENNYVFKEREITLDTQLDFAAILAGNIASFTAEKWKEYINRNEK